VLTAHLYFTQFLRDNLYLLKNARGNCGARLLESRKSYWLDKICQELEGIIEGGFEAATAPSKFNFGKKGALPKYLLHH